MVARIKLEDAPKAPEEDVSEKKRNWGKVTEVGAVKATLYYTTAESAMPQLKEVRRYFIGSVMFAFVEVYKDGYGPDKYLKDGSKVAKFAVHMADGKGNGGHRFGNEANLEAFLRQTLNGQP